MIGFVQKVSRPGRPVWVCVCVYAACFTPSAFYSLPKVCVIEERIVHRTRILCLRAHGGGYLYFFLVRFSFITLFRGKMRSLFLISFDVLGFLDGFLGCGCNWTTSFQGISCKNLISHMFFWYFLVFYIYLLRTRWIACSYEKDTIFI